MEGKIPRQIGKYAVTCAALTDAIVLRVSDEWLAGASEACRAVFESRFLRQMAQRLIDANARIAQVP